MKTVYYLIPTTVPTNGTILYIVMVGQSPREKSELAAISQIAEKSGFYFHKRDHQTQEFAAKFTNCYHFGYFDLLITHPRVFSPYIVSVSTWAALEIVREAATIL